MISTLKGNNMFILLSTKWFPLLARCSHSEFRKHDLVSVQSLALKNHYRFLNLCELPWSILISLMWIFLYISFCLMYAICFTLGGWKATETTDKKLTFTTGIELLLFVLFCLLLCCPGLLRLVLLSVTIIASRLYCQIHWWFWNVQLAICLSLYVP